MKYEGEKEKGEHFFSPMYLASFFLFLERLVEKKKEKKHFIYNHFTSCTTKVCAI